MAGWTCAMEMNAAREVAGGCPEALSQAIGRGADLRIGTEFLHNEHIDVRSPSSERIREVAQFAVTYLIDRRWAAGIMSLRQPVELPDAFGARPSMSFFLYNQDGHQAIARPYLDGGPAPGTPGPSAPSTPENMPKYHTQDNWDSGTNAPSSNFIYDFDVYRFWVNDSWREVLSHDVDGSVRSGSIDALADAFAKGHAIKIGVSSLCGGLAEDPPALEHEVFVEAGSCYYYTEQRVLIAGSHPLIRVAPAIPMRYTTSGWDFGWLLARTDGAVVYRRCDPYTLAFSDIVLQCGMRWFVR